jgi:hypothetical protein
LVQPSLLDSERRLGLGDGAVRVHDFRGRAVIMCFHAAGSSSTINCYRRAARSAKELGLEGWPAPHSDC